LRKRRASIDSKPGQLIATTKKKKFFKYAAPLHYEIKRKD
jgi:hypothetical protein